MEDLTRCVELGKLLLQPEKEVEDDTCLDRILSGVAKLLRSTNEGCSSSFMEEHFEVLRTVMGELSMHHPVSAHGYLIQLLSHVLLAVPRSSSFRNTVTLILSYPDSQMQTRQNDEYYSLASSWLSAIKNILPVWEYISDLPETAQVYQHIIAMAYSQSLFVRRQAVESLAIIFIKLHGMGEDVEIIYKKFSSNSNGPSSLSSLLDLSRAMLTFSYSDGMHILASQEFRVSLLHNIDELTQLCYQCDPVLCHFFESLYCDSNYKCSNDILTKVISPSETLRCAITCISQHPTKSAGWKILISLVKCTESSHERDVAVSLVTNSLKRWEHSDAYETMPFEYTVKCCDVFISLRNNISAMGRIFCHILNAIGSSTHHMPSRLTDTLLHLVQTILSTSNHDPNGDGATERLFMENSNAMVALLSSLSKTCLHFTSDEQAGVHELVLALIAKSSTHHAVIISCHQVMKLLLQSCYNRDFLSKCVYVTNGLFVDRRWEVRDSALQFFSTLLSVLHDTARLDVLDAYTDYAVCTECMKLCDDSNAFVRATALTLLGGIISSSQICDSDTVLEIILKSMNDIDLFPRRSGVTVLLHFLKNNNKFLNLLHKAETNNSSLNTGNLMILKIQSAIHKALFEDLDWEVKYNSLCILQLLLEYDLQHHTSPSTQLLSLLHKMEEDYDDAVKEKARGIATSLNITPHQKLKETELQSQSELHSLLVEALTSLRNNAKDDRSTAFVEENSVIVDCY